MTEEITITRYGLHQHQKIQYLHQHSQAGHNFLGLKRESPFKLVYSGPKAPMCPHNFQHSVGQPDRYHWNQFLQYYRDPFFKAFVPVPREMGEFIPYMDDLEGKWATLAVLFSRLASPTTSIVFSIENQKRDKVLEMLQITNLAPLVLINIENRHQSLIEQLAVQAAYCPRKLILIGKPSLVIRPPMKRITSVMDQIDPLSLMPLPLESMGTVALRRYARGEVIDTAIDKLEERWK